MPIGISQLGNPYNTFHYANSEMCEVLSKNNDTLHQINKKKFKVLKKHEFL